MSAPGRARQTTPPAGSSQKTGDAHNPTTGKLYSQTIHVSKGATQKDEDKPKMSSNDLTAELAAEALITCIIHPGDKTAASKPLPYTKDNLHSMINIVDTATIKQLEAVPEEGRIFKTLDGKKITVDELLGVRKQDSKTSELQKRLDDRSDKLKEKEEELKKKDETPKEIEKKLNYKEKELLATKGALEKKGRELNELNERSEVREGVIEDLNKKVNELEKKNEKLDKEMQDVRRQYDEKIKQLNSTIGEQKETIQVFERKMEDTNQENTKLRDDNKYLRDKLKQSDKKCQTLESKLNRERITIENMRVDHEDEIRKIHNQTKDLVAERDDLRNRFSKLAGAKLTDQNPDIADLSDPNRAMKLSDKFGALYDDQWTDAFEALRDKKITAREAIDILLNVLKKCEDFFKKLREGQMDSLKNVLLHPSQDISTFGTDARKHVGGLKEHERLTSADKKAMRELRRQVGVSEGVLEEVKQVFLLETKKWEEKKLLESCTPYLQRCAELCWLIVTHDPPLYIKMDVKHGDRMDLNLYNRYSSSGSTIDYLVWPALFNEKDGGLLSKGTAEPIRTVKKD